MTNQEIYDELGQMGSLLFIGVTLAGIDGKVDKSEFVDASSLGSNDVETVCSDTDGSAEGHAPTRANGVWFG